MKTPSGVPRGLRKIKGLQAIACGQPKNMATSLRFMIIAILLRLTNRSEGDEKVLRYDYIISEGVRNLVNILLSKIKLLLYFLLKNKTNV